MRHVLGGHATALVEGLPKPLAASARGGCLGIPPERGATGERLEAADVAAATHDVRVVDDLDVPDVARRSLRAAVERPSEMMPAPMPVPIFTNTTLSWPDGDAERATRRAP